MEVRLPELLITPFIVAEHLVPLDEPENVGTKSKKTDPPLCANANAVPHAGAPTTVMVMLEASISICPPLFAFQCTFWLEELTVPTVSLPIILITPPLTAVIDAPEDACVTLDCQFTIAPSVETKDCPVTGLNWKP